MQFAKQGNTAIRLLAAALVIVTLAITAKIVLNTDCDGTAGVYVRCAT